MLLRGARGSANLFAKVAISAKSCRSREAPIYVVLQFANTQRSRKPAAIDHPTSDEFVEKLTAQLTAQASQLTSSMYRDLEKGVLVEVDAILGDLLEHGRKYGLTMPTLQAALVNVSIYQHRRERAKAASI